MNPAEEINLRAELIVHRELIKCLIGLLPDDEYYTEVLEAMVKRVVASTPEFTQERLAMQRAVNLVGPLTIQRRNID